MTLNPGDSLLNGHYRIIRQLGRGGFGFVYLAQDTLLDEAVAIKELIPALVGDETMLKRFLAEAKATMRLRHKRIVGTHNVFNEGGNYYIVMEYMPGGSLEERLRQQGSIPVDEAIRIAAEVCEGLACAHEEGVVHCDLKPANILFAADGSAKVADFGIAHVSGEMLSRSWLTPAGFVAGTLPYMSPEQADDVRDDPRIDVYALGAVLSRSLTGRTYLEFDRRETPGATADNVHRIRHETPAPPGTYDRRVPAWLDGVVAKALAKQPQARYNSAAEFRAALLQRPASQEGAASVPAQTRPAPPRLAPPPSAAPVKARPARRAPLPSWFWVAAGGAVALLIVLGFAIGAALWGGDGTGKGTSATCPAATTPATPRPTDTPPSSRTAPPASKAPQGAETQTRAKDGMVMVYVPAGEFTMGSNQYDDEKPVHTVALDAFWIDRTEVSNAQFRQCVEAGVCQAPTTCDWGDPTYDDGDKTNHPVVCVNWSQAQAYCQWAGARLPTEAEWEKAARGTDGRVYPWGNDFDCRRGNFDDEQQIDDYVVPGGPDCDGYKQTAPVGSYPAGASPYGALDMAGNVWEWVNDWYDGGYYAISPSTNPKGPDSGDYRVPRGGSWGDDDYVVRAALRDGGDPAYRSSVIGFRCVVAGPGG
jgi:formylglycine-generating enzyme required for sulfatase activity